MIATIFFRRTVGCDAWSEAGHDIWETVWNETGMARIRLRCHPTDTRKSIMKRAEAYCRRHGYDAYALASFKDGAYVKRLSIIHEVPKHDPQ